jgi:tryptophan-rich sensory protein
LVIGVVCSSAGSAAFAMSSFAMHLNRNSDDVSYDSLIRWSLFNGAAGLAALLLVAGGLFAAANRVAGITRTLLLIAAWIHVSYLGWLLARPVLFEVLIKNPETLRLFDEYGARALSVLFWTAPVLITVAARAWWRPATPWVTVAAVVLVTLEATSWAPYVRSTLEELSDNHPYVYTLFWPIRELLSSGALLLVIYGITRDAPPALMAPARGITWLRSASALLMARVVAAIALAVLGIGLVRSPGAIKFVLLLGPAITVLAIYGFSWSLLGIERAELPGMPKLRLGLGAAFTAIAAGFQSFQMVAAYRQLGDRDSLYASQEAEMWSVIGPLIGIVGMVLSCSAIASWARVVPNQPLRESAIARGIVHAALSGAVMLFPFFLKGASSMGAVLAVGVLAAVAAVVSIVIVATMFRRAADLIVPAPVLPEARLHQ